MPSAGRSRAVARRSLALALDDFAWEAVQHESTRLGVSGEELIAFAVLYYLADIDSGRTARRLPGRLGEGPLRESGRGPLPEADSPGMGSEHDAES